MKRQVKKVHVNLFELVLKLVWNSLWNILKKCLIQKGHYLTF